MRLVRLSVLLAGVIAAAAAGLTGFAAPSDSPPAGIANSSADDWALYAGNEIDLTPDVVYRQASGTDLKADIYTPAGAAGPVPTILTMHGGGWVEGSKEGAALAILPYLERGFAVVNLSYRLGRVAPAPAAVEDCRCALRWVLEHAGQYHFDPKRIITMGWSAGGHLALTTALLPVSAGFDSTCPTPDPARWASGEQPEVKVAAVVNFFGITDVADLLDGPDAKHYAVEWLGSRSDRADLARRVSPLQYVKAGAPPVLTVHGEVDPYVPYSHAMRLHRALDAAHVPNRLVTIKGGGHGDFTRVQERDIHAAIFAFLAEHGLMPAAPSAMPAGGR
ncbi:MAG TPA: alpha/beta hydrolase [Candidatus Polarisedimenticolia bacterium]|jgi:acetyl esterase/lipase|nr:alpha/beta hydrolase [Candidatus Polarisedimenticolia bacterium]